MWIADRHVVGRKFVVGGQHGDSRAGAIEADAVCAAGLGGIQHVDTSRGGSELGEIHGVRWQDLFADACDSHGSNFSGDNAESFMSNEMEPAAPTV